MGVGHNFSQINEIGELFYLVDAISPPSTVQLLIVVAVCARQLQRRCDVVRGWNWIYFSLSLSLSGLGGRSSVEFSGGWVVSAWGWEREIGL